MSSLHARLEPNIPYLTRIQASEYLISKGYRISPFNLATIASRKRGPYFIKIGNYCFYNKDDIDSWLASSDCKAKPSSGGILPSNLTLNSLVPSPNSLVPSRSAE
jgi:hypothetical protein